MPVRKPSGKLSPIERFRKIFTDIDSPNGGLPTMPTKITSLDLDALGDLISRYTAWREYTEDRHAEACAVFSQIKSEYDLAIDKKTLVATGDTITERKIIARSDNSIAELYENLCESEIYKDLLASKLESFTNVLSMLSRDLTRRGID